MNLLLLTFGECIETHYQAVFSILSFLKDPLIKKAIVITDNPDFYYLLRDKVEIITINQKILKDWQEPYQFFWKVKIKALELVVELYPSENLLYVDSDTFLATDLKEIKYYLDKNSSFMHIFEDKLSNNKSKTFKKMYRVLNGKYFSGIKVDDQSEMWNAGVVALPAYKAQEIIQLSLNICDEMCSTMCPRRLIEQFAFSISLAELTSLKSCETIIGHYWGNKFEWNNKIAEFLLNCQLKGLDVSESIEILKTFDWTQIPLEKKRRNIAERLIKYINHIFKPKFIRYIKSDV